MTILFNTLFIDSPILTFSNDLSPLFNCCTVFIELPVAASTLFPTLTPVKTNPKTSNDVISFHKHSLL